MRTFLLLRSIVYALRLVVFIKCDPMQPESESLGANIILEVIQDQLLTFYSHQPYHYYDMEVNRSGWALFSPIVIAPLKTLDSRDSDPSFQRSDRAGEPIQATPSSPLATSSVSSTRKKINHPLIYCSNHLSNTRLHFPTLFNLITFWIVLA